MGFHENQLMLKFCRLASIWKFFLVGAILVLKFTISSASADVLQVIIPAGSVLNGIKPIGAPQKVEGEELFKIINGGAVIFFQHRFKRALFQEYEMQDNKIITLEIYQMDSQTDANRIYNRKRGEEGKKLTIGQEGLVAGYYCIFWQGPFYITVTGNESSENVRKELVTIARIVAKNIKEQFQNR